MIIPRSLSFVCLLTCSLAIPPVLRAQSGTPIDFNRYRAQMESRTSVHVLPNGLTLVLSERHEAPVFSFYTMVDAGSANDPEGRSGLAHMFEHIAFKGTTEIGTTNYPAEKAALAKVEVAYAAYDEAYRRQHGGEVNADPAKLAALHATFEKAVAAAQQYVVPNQFSEIAESNGAVGLNAQTSEDSTDYFWSMPENRLELWAYLESSRIGFPVAREFYKERDVVNEERRMRIDSSPLGKLVEQFLAAAYVAHPYGRPGVGWESDITQVSATEAAAFHAKYYVPANIVIAVVGDFKTAEALPMLTRYFGQIPAGGPKPVPMTTVEPPQTSTREVVLKMPNQPVYLEGYHRPSYRNPDDAVYDAITDIVSSGRTGRLYRALVRDQHIAADAEGFTDFPGNKFPEMFAFYAAPLRGHTDDEMRDAVHKQLELLKTTDVSNAELTRYKRRAEADILRGLDSNESLAATLATYQTRFGDWREMFDELKHIDAVTKADVRRVAGDTFRDSNRTSARIEFAAPPTPASGAPPTAAATTGGAR